MYTSQQNVEMMRGFNLSAEEALWFRVIEPAVQKFIDSQIGESFISIHETRYYDGEGTIFNIDPCRNVSEVSYVNSDETVSSSLVLDKDFEARPRNEDIKTYIQFRGGKIPKGVTNIAVTADFGYGEIPEDVKYLATYLCNLFIDQQITSGKTKESIEGYSVEFKTLADDKLVNMVLDKYKRILL